MRLLLDTHALLWWLAGEPMADESIQAIGDPANEVFVSAASAWEIVIKRAIGKLDFPGPVAATVADNGFTELPVTMTHTEAVGELPPLHRDPFDRLLIAQARTEQLTFISRDDNVARYDVSLLGC